MLEKKAALAALASGTMARCVWNELYVSELWNTVRFPDGHVYEDGCTLIRIIGMADHVVTVPGCPVRHRIHPGSITQTWSAQNVRDWIRSRKQIEEYVEKNTPHLFPDGMLSLVQKETAEGMIPSWARAAKDDREYAESLRREILRKKQSLDFGSWGLRSRMAYWMLHFCPWMLPAALPVYRLLRRLYAGMTGR